MKGICKFLLKLMGWTVVGEPAPVNKCIIIGGTTYQCLGFCYFVVVLHLERCGCQHSYQKGIFLLACWLFCKKNGRFAY